MNELGDFEFLVSLVIWYEILTAVNVVSKRLQTKDMVLDVAIDQVNKLIKFFKEYREVGFSKAIDEAKQIAIEMGIDPVFQQRRVIRRKKHFDETSSEEEFLFSPEDDFKKSIISYLLLIKQLVLLKEDSNNTNIMKIYLVFCFLKKLRELDDNDLKSRCHFLQDALMYGEKSDIDGNELYLELKMFETTLPSGIISPFDALENLKNAGFFPNALIAYRFLLTIPVTVASAERSFSKLKLLKSYLRSTMSQDRLNGLAMIAIENDVLEDMDYKELIENFATKNTRRASRFV